jgi:ABC-type bacteriocin/lantibiotic exporter with double-glycine peptidase domain
LPTPDFTHLSAPIDLERLSQRRAGFFEILQTIFTYNPGLLRRAPLYWCAILLGRAAGAFTGYAFATAMGKPSMLGSLVGIGVGLGAIFFISKLIDFFCIYLQGSLFARWCAEASYNVCAPLFGFAMRLPATSFGSRSAAEWASKLDRANDIRLVLGYLTNHLGQAFLDMAAALIVLSFMGVGDLLWVGTAIALGIALSTWSVNKWATDHAADIKRKADESTQASMAHSTELLSKIALAKAYGNEEFFLKLRRAASEQERMALNRVRMSDLGATSVCFGLSGLGYAAMFSLGISHMRSGELSPALFAASMALIAGVFARMSMMLYAFEGLNGACIALSLPVGLLREHALDFERLVHTPPSPKASLSSLHIEQLSVRYEEQNRPTLDRISFELPLGSIAWLVGASGSGKTSLLRAIMKSIDSTGSIVWDGRPAHTWSHLCAWVPQDAGPTEGSIRWTLSIGDQAASDQKMTNALAAAGLLSRVVQAGGLDAVVGHMGLSGGERQRLAIARAFVSNHPLILMDEPSAGLDALSEIALFKELVNNKSNASAIITIHRLRAIPAGGRVIMLGDGYIVEDGPIEELLSRPGPFHSLWNTLAPEEKDTP